MVIEAILLAPTGALVFILIHNLAAAAAAANFQFWSKQRGESCGPQFNIFCCMSIFCPLFVDRLVSIQISIYSHFL